MIEPLAFLWPPFLVAVCLVGIHAYFGIQVLARKVIFVDLALAQIAALGATVAFMLGHPAQSPATYGYSLAFTLLAAVLLAFTRAWGTRVPQEALIGVIYVVAAAAAILLIDRAPQGAEHLKQILTGNILTSGLNEVAVIVPLYAAIGLLHWLLRRRLTGAGPLVLGIRVLCEFRRGRDQLGRDCRRAAGLFVSRSFPPPSASCSRRRWHDSSRSAGLPARSPAPPALPPLLPSICRPAPPWFALLAPRWRSRDCSTRFCAGNRRHALRVAIATARWCAAAILAASALQLAAAPRADQPLIDMAEYAVPSLRSAVFHAQPSRRPSRMPAHMRSAIASRRSS